MRFPKNILVLHCQLGCGRVVGEAATIEPMDEDEYRASTGIVDQRCTQCEGAHGTFAELADTMKKEVPEATPDEVEKFIIRNPKRAQFRTALNTEVAKREKAMKKKEV